jgi:hypothetical protein
MVACYSARQNGGEDKGAEGVRRGRRRPRQSWWQAEGGDEEDTVVAGKSDERAEKSMCLKWWGEKKKRGRVVGEAFCEVCWNELLNVCRHV